MKYLPPWPVEHAIIIHAMPMDHAVLPKLVNNTARNKLGSLSVFPNIIKINKPGPMSQPNIKYFCLKWKKNVRRTIWEKRLIQVQCYNILFNIPLRMRMIHFIAFIYVRYAALLWSMNNNAIILNRILIHFLHWLYFFR